MVDWLASRNPEERPRSARAALARLERARSSPEPPTRAFEPTFERPAPVPTPPAPASTPAPGRQGSRRGRWAAVTALAVFLAAVVGIAAAVLGGDGEERSPPRQADAKENAASREGQQEETTAKEEPAEEEPAEEEPATKASVPTAEGSDPARGAALNEEGFALLQSGDYEAAVPVLEEAVEAFPADSEELDYAYALFNLGNALRLSGRPEEAIPVLERRLEIPNQTGTVEEELAAARAEAG
jgi:tetratricopeptide (TPR) repeat protein